MTAETDRLALARRQSVLFDRSIVDEALSQLKLTTLTAIAEDADVK